MAKTLEKDVVGKREDLSNIIALVDPEVTPMFSGLPKGPAPANTLLEWQADAYAAVSIAGVVDGTDVSSSTEEDASVNRKKIQGRIQHVRRHPRVSTLTQEVANIAGIGAKRAFAAAVAKKLKELRRDMEAIIGADQDSQADAGGSTPYLTRGFGFWIQNGAQGDLAVDSSYRTPTASIYNADTVANLTEANVQDLIKSIYENSGEVDRFFTVCGTDLKRKFSDFALYNKDLASHTAIRQFNQDGASKMIVATIDVYEGDCGTLELHKDLFLGYGTAANTKRGYVLNTDRARLRFTMMPGSREIEDRGGGRQGIVEAIFGLQCDNPLAHGKFDPTA